jgi:glycosyltransferase involved in cell wall biosynthesis
MEERAKKSSRFSNFNSTTIPNPISEVFLRDQPRGLARQALGIPDKCVVFIAIAASLSDPAKQIKRLVSSFVSISSPDPTDKLLLLVGAAGERYENLEAGVRWLGALSSSELAEVAGAADWVLSTSIAESAGMTIVECGALGVPSIVLDSGGVRDMIINSVTGLLADSYDEFERCLRLAARKEVASQDFGQAAKAFARNRHDPRLVAKRYLTVYGG